MPRKKPARIFEYMQYVKPSDTAYHMLNSGDIDQEQHDNAALACQSVGVGEVEEGIRGEGFWTVTGEGVPGCFDTADQAVIARLVAQKIAIQLYGRITDEGAIEKVIAIAIGGMRIFPQGGA